MAADAGVYQITVEPFQQEEGEYAIHLKTVEPVATTKSGKVTQLLTQYDRTDAPGVAVAVVENGTAVYSRGFGMANLEYQLPITTSTVFDIASLSKQIGAMAIALLVDQGKLSLDDDVRMHFPEVPDFGKTITIRHLLHHTSGVRDWPAALAISGVQMDDVISFEQILRMVQNQRELNFSPGEEYSYSNTGYNILAEVIQRLTGQSFREWTNENIFKPLEMNNSHFQDNHQEIVPGRAYGYAPGDNGFVAVNNGLTALASSSLFSTTDDLVKWVKNFDQMTVGNAAVMEMVHTQGVLNNGEQISYALGHNIGSHRGLKRIQHSGSWAGFRTYLARFPDQGISVILFSNAANTNAAAIATQISDIYLEEYFAEEPEEEAEEAPDTEPTTQVTVPITTLDRFAGEWLIDNGPTVVFVRDGGILYAQIQGQQRFEMIPTDQNAFKIDVPGVQASVSFELPAEGKAQTATVDQGGVTHMRRVESWSPNEVELDEFTGRYFNAELEAYYTITVAKDHLVATHLRNQPIALTPREKDVFDSDAWFFGLMTFERDNDGEINGFRISSSRVRNVLFEKR